MKEPCYLCGEYVEVCICFGFCLNLQHYVIASSDCEQEEAD